MKTSELSGTALDWAVARCEVGADFIGEIDDPHFYSTDWAQGGAIIEREGIALLPGWTAERPGFSAEGETALISAMRCYVASKLGDEVALPEGVML